MDVSLGCITFLLKTDSMHRAARARRDLQGHPPNRKRLLRRVIPQNRRQHARFHFTYDPHESKTTSDEDMLGYDVSDWISGDLL